MLNPPVSFVIYLTIVMTQKTAKYIANRFFFATDPGEKARGLSE